MAGLIISALIALGVVILLFMVIRIVPQRQVYVVERLGKYQTSLEAGLHFLMPFIDRVAYKHSQKEIVRDVPRQSCITKDNIEVSIDGVMYLQVIDPKSASYGVDDYVMAAQQLAQTTLRSVIGKIDLDKTFEERGEINMEVVKAVDEAAQPWGVKVLRYEVAASTCPYPSRMPWRNRSAPSGNVARWLLNPKVSARPPLTVPRVTARRRSTAPKVKSRR